MTNITWNPGRFTQFLFSLRHITWIILRSKTHWVAYYFNNCESRKLYAL